MQDYIGYKVTKSENEDIKDMQDYIGYKVTKSENEDIKEGSIILGYDCYLDAYAALYSHLTVRWYYIDHRKEDFDKIFQYSIYEIILFNPDTSEVTQVRVPISVRTNNILSMNKIEAEPFLTKEKLDNLLIKISLMQRFENLYNYETFKQYLLNELTKGLLEGTLDFYKRTLDELWITRTASVFRLVVLNDGRYRYKISVLDDSSKWYKKRAEDYKEELKRFFEVYQND